MKDFTGNIIAVGEQVITLTVPRVGSKYKRLFLSEVLEVTDKKCKVYCFENSREVWVKVYG